MDASNGLKMGKHTADYRLKITLLLIIETPQLQEGARILL